MWRFIFVFKDNVDALIFLSPKKLAKKVQTMHSVCYLTNLSVALSSKQTGSPRRKSFKNRHKYVVSFFWKRLCNFLKQLITVVFNKPDQTGANRASAGGYLKWQNMELIDEWAI